MKAYNKQIVKAILLLLLATASFAVGQTTDEKKANGTSLEQQLVELKRAWGRAYVQRDAAFIEKLMAQEYTVTNAKGQTTTRAELMADFKSGEAVYEATSYDDAKVSVYGNVAIVAGRGMVKGKSKSGPFHTQYFSTNVFELRDGRWQAVATHISGLTSLIESGKPSTANPFNTARSNFVALSVRDVGRSQTWYAEKLGFRVLKADHSPAQGVRFAMLELNGFHLELLGIESSKPRDSVLPDTSKAYLLQSIFKFGFLVDDLDQVAAGLRAKGVDLKLKPVADEQFGFKFLQVEDPDKNLIQVFQKIK